MLFRGQRMMKPATRPSRRPLPATETRELFHACMVLQGRADAIWERLIYAHAEAMQLLFSQRQRFLFGEKPTVADASVASVLISCATEFFDTPLTKLVRGHTNLVAYMDRMKGAYFARNLWPVSEMA